MIHSTGNVECFEWCEISPKIQCLHCMTYQTERIVCCDCGCELSQLVFSVSTVLAHPHRLFALLPMLSHRLKAQVFNKRVIHGIESTHSFNLVAERWFALHKPMRSLPSNESLKRSNVSMRSRDDHPEAFRLLRKVKRKRPRLDTNLIPPFDPIVFCIMVVVFHDMVAIYFQM